MSELMTVFEMQNRYQEEEDPFDLTVEKWIRIRQFLNTASSLSDFQELSQAANIPIPFCFEYQIKDCLGCALENTCGRGKGEKFFKVMRIIQAYFLAGDLLPKETLISEIEDFLMELEMLRAKSKGLIH